MISDDAITEQAYLVARGVRPLAIVSEAPEQSPDARRQAHGRLADLAKGEAIPFAVSNGQGTTTYGFARAPWVIDLFEWSVTAAIPDKRRVEIIGLLLGYGVEDVARFHAMGSGQRMTPQLPDEGPGDVEMAAATRRHRLALPD